MIQCDFCERKAKQTCDYCGRDYCEEHGGEHHCIECSEEETESSTDDDDLKYIGE